EKPFASGRQCHRAHQFCRGAGFQADRSHAGIATALGAPCCAGQRGKPTARAAMARNAGRGCPGRNRPSAVRLRSADQLEEAFGKFARERVDALLIPPDVTFATHRQRIVNLALGARLPTIFFQRQSAEDGGLLSYGPDQVENFRRAATYVDKILKGAKPQDLPIERPTKFELVINRIASSEIVLTEQWVEPELALA